MKLSIEIFNRVTTSGTVIPIIDGLRFISISSVVLYHCFGYADAAVILNPINIIARKGWFGVQLFFAISGFILSKIFATKYLLNSGKIPLRKYYLRRITRLEPTYLSALIIYFVIKAFILNYTNLINNFLASTFYSHNLIFGERSKIIGVAWSLEIEIQFYILMPVLALVFRIKSKYTRRIFLCVCTLLMTTVNTYFPFNYKTFISFLNYFLIGFIFCDIYILDWKNGNVIKKSSIWDMVSFFSWTAIILFLYGNKFLNILIPWLVLSAFIAAFKGKISSSVLANKYIYIIGGMCYTIYLYHPLLLRVLILNTPIKNVVYKIAGEFFGFSILALISIVFVFAISSFLFLILEKPFMYPYWPSKVKNKILNTLNFKKNILTG